MRVSEFKLIAPDESETETVACLPGEVATGGGLEVNNGQTRDMMATTSMPEHDAAGKPTGWYARAYNLDSNEDDLGNVSVRAYAVCASP